MPYAVTKAAQLQLVKCLAVTVGPNIRVNTVLPGLLLTEWVSIVVLESLSKRNANDTGPEISGRAHRCNQEHGDAQARDVSGRLCRCVCHAGQEYEYDGDEDSGGCRVECAGSVDDIFNHLERFPSLLTLAQLLPFPLDL
jgi:hypothetical protein